MYSFILAPTPESENTIGVMIKPFAKPGIDTAIDWPSDRQSANGEFYGIDRGIPLDAYTVEVTFHGDVSDMENLGEWLEEYGREPFYLTQIDGLVFPPHMDHSGPILVAPVLRNLERRTFFSPTDTGVNEISMTLRAVQPVFTDLSPASLSELILPEKFTTDKTSSVEIVFSDDGEPLAIDTDMDAGVFSATFEQDSESTSAALRFLLVEMRENSFLFPPFPGVDYPFGKARGALPKTCKCKNLSLARKSLNRWALTLDLVESFES